MTQTHSDALVFFGATGDLAYKKIFPALQHMIQHGHLDVPIVGVAKSGWTVEQLRARARDSLEKHGGVDEPAFAKLVERLRYIDGDYSDPATFVQLREALGEAEAAVALPGDPAERVRHRGRTTSRSPAAARTPGSSSRSRSVATCPPPRS